MKTLSFVLILSCCMIVRPGGTTAEGIPEGTRFLVYGPSLVAGKDAEFFVVIIGPDKRLVESLDRYVLLRLEVEGPAEATPLLLGPELFEGGAAPVWLYGVAPGEVSLTLYSHKDPVLKKTITVKPSPEAPEYRAPTPVAGKAEGETPGADAAPLAGDPLREISLDRIVAVAGEEPVSAADREREQVWSFLPDWRGMVPEERSGGQLLQDVVDRLLLRKKASELGIVASPEEIEAALAAIKEAFTVEGVDLVGFLSRSGLTEDDLRRRVGEDQEIRDMIIEQVIARVVVSDEEVERYYQEQLDSMGLPEERRVRLISFSGAGLSSPGERIAHLRELLNEGVSFRVLAEEYSEGPASAEGGEIGWVAAGDVEGPLGETIFNSTVGEYRVVEHPRGMWNIVEVTAVRQALPPREDMLRATREFLLAERTDEALRRWIQRLREQTGFEVLAP